MVDRIADPWGERTPYGPGEPWPVRVDEYVTTPDVQRWAQSASILHANGDAMDIAVHDGRIVGVRGRAGDRINHGRLDPKDLVGILNDLQSAGLVLREPDPTDRRKNAVSLTDEGARLLNRCEKAAREANDELLAPLSVTERAQLMNLLIRISGTQG